MKWLMLVTWFWVGSVDSYQVGFVDDVTCRIAAETLRAETVRVREELETRKAAASSTRDASVIAGMGPLPQVTAVCVKVK